MSKTQIWRPDPEAVLPPQYTHYGQYRVDKLTAAGSTLAYADHDVDADWRDVPLTDFATPAGLEEETAAVGAGAALGAGGPPSRGQAFLNKQDSYFRELLMLHKHGLSAFDAVQLGRTWSRGACAHMQRALPPTEACKPTEWMTAWSPSSVDCWAQLRP
eukprot:8526270-Pyramimonas_sp.AAC.1